MAIWKRRPVVHTVYEGDLKAAYDQGRRDERVSRNSHPVIAMMVVLLALVGGSLLYLAAREGSFSTAGQVADHKLAIAAAEAGPAIHSTVEQTGEAIKDAGGAIKDKSQDLVGDATR